MCSTLGEYLWEFPLYSPASIYATLPCTTGELTESYSQVAILAVTAVICKHLMDLDMPEATWEDISHTILRLQKEIPSFCLGET